MTPTDPDSPPFPVLFNPWKHHAGWVGRRVAESAADGQPGVRRLAAELVVLGGATMDLYTGPLSVAEVGEHVVAGLTADGRLDPAVFAEWLSASGGYAVVPLPDGSTWALRLGVADGRYVHIHPGRYAAHTVRVKADPWRTAVVAHAVGRLTGQPPADVRTVNAARVGYLGLPPVPAVGGGIGEALSALGGAASRHGQ